MTSSTRRRSRLQLVETVARSLQRVVFYCRVSTDEQADQNTIQLQLDYLRGRYRPDLEGLGQTPMELVTEIVDEGWSGALPLEERPGGERVLQLARDRQFDVLILYKVDRLGRKASVLLNAHDTLEEYGISLTSATEPFDTRPGPMQAFGKFVFQLLGSIAELERSTIANRTMGGKLRVAREDKFVNGQIPFGYKVTAAGLLVPNDVLVPEAGVTEAELVTELFERIKGGDSTYSLADWLGDLGVRTPRRWWNKKREAVTESSEALPWNHVRVWETIRNETYRGDRLLSFDDRGDHMQHPPALVSVELWHDANAKMSNVCSKIVGSVEGWRAWTVHPLPARGQLSNVSAVVLPARRAMADDGRVPMFGEAKFLRALADLAASVRETAHMQRETQELLARQLELFSGGHVFGGERRLTARESHPVNPKWRTYRGFVLDLQHLESLLGPYVKVTKAALTVQGSDSVRTITRTMKAYGLDPGNWPPSTWNADEQRVYRPQKGGERTPF